MSCAVNETELSSLLDGELDAVADRRLMEHLAVCSSCRVQLERLRNLSGTLRAWDRSLARPTPPRFVDRIVAAAVRRPSRRRLARIRSLPAPLAAAAVLLLLIGLGAGMLVAGLPSRESPRGPVEAPARAAYRERAAALAAGDARGHLVLARWCRESGLEDLALREYLRALGADPGLNEAREALADLIPPRPAPADPLLVHVPELPDLGPDLPSRTPRVRTPGREDVLARLGFSRTGGRWLTEEARRRQREFREDTELLARVEERKRALLAAAPPASAVNPVAEFLASLSPAERVAREGLSFVPLRDGDGDPGISVVGTAEAFESGILTVEEDASQGRLAARNLDRKRHVFLAAGEILAGGHQDRILIRDVLLLPNTTARLPVVCCERNRWIGVTEVFGESPGIAPPAIRALLLGAADQDAIWARIEEQLATLGAENPTGALRAAYATGRGPERVRAVREAFRAAFDDGHTVGFLAFSGDRFLGGEVFADHAIFAALGPRYLAAYALQAGSALSVRAAGAKGPDPRACLDAAVAAGFYPTGAAGSGQETEFVARDHRLRGHALVPVAGARPLHVALFPGPGPDPTGDEPPPEPPAVEGGETGSTTAPEDPEPPPAPPPDPRDDRARDRRRGGLAGAAPPGRSVKPPAPDHGRGVSPPTGGATERANPGGGPDRRRRDPVAPGTKR